MSSSKGDSPGATKGLEDLLDRYVANGEAEFPFSLLNKTAKKTRSLDPLREKLLEYLRSGESDRIGAAALVLTYVGGRVDTSSFINPLLSVVETGAEVGGESVFSAIREGLRWANPKTNELSRRLVSCITEGLGHSVTRDSVLYLIRGAGELGWDLSAVVPALVGLLEDCANREKPVRLEGNDLTVPSSIEFRHRVLLALEGLGRSGDLSGAERILMAYCSKKNHDSEAAGVLLQHYVRTANWPEILELASHPRRSVRTKTKQVGGESLTAAIQQAGEESDERLLRELQTAKSQLERLGGNRTP